ncbi:zinc-binding dehydrogenase [Pseudactinotalea terrae]|uniref:zinc-binding dehydrogenase n=1 Tax=Pseudactinotalea terrae TaxID=1743262 RepID=UPI0012E23C7C|nr:alcohol dehydrogenase catalytic domain-containing protein [Pseudactinotalea terrae]
MRALVYDTFGGPVAVREVPDPVAPPGGVVVEVHATGLCRSDWHAWMGHEEFSLPHIGGHELAGVVVEVGDDVARWVTGDRVTIPFVEGCGRCDWCDSGNAQVCPDQQQPGFTHAGSFAERVALHAADTNLIRVPDGLSFEAVAVLGCRFATAYRALVARAHLREHEWLTVVGAGGVGLSAVMLATSLGARTIAVDPSREALALARELGAEHTLMPDGDTTAEIHHLTEGGAHVAMDALGSESAAAAAIGSLRRRGRHLQVGLLPAVAGHPRIPMDRVIAWELDVLGSHGMAAADYPDMLALVESGTLAPQRLIRRVVSLEDAAALLPAMASSAAAGLTVIDPRMTSDQGTR